MSHIKELGPVEAGVNEANSFANLTHTHSVAIQRGNAAHVLGTMKMDDEELFG